MGRSRQALIAPPAPPPPQEVPWSVCALVTADGRTYQCGGGGTPYTNNFGNRTGNPQNDILFSTNDAGYAADNRRVSLEIDQVNRNLDDRIRQMGERVDAARQALPDWLTRNGQALDAGIQVTGARTDQQAADREQFTRANATAITDAATTTETFIQSPFDRSRTTAFLASVGGVNASLPDLPASALPPDAPALRGITANDRIYGSSSTFFAKQLQRERAKVDEQLQAGGALRRLALEELAVAEQFGASGTEAGAQVAQALLKDSAAARFAGTGRLPALTLTTVGLDGTIGDRLIGDPTVLPADALIVRVRQFEADSDAFDLRASGIRAALTPDVPNYLRRLDAFNVAERTAAIGRRTFTKGDVAEAHMQMSMGTRVLDFVTQFVPLVNEGRSIAETLTGRNGVTGEDLGAVQRTVVGVGIVVGGLGEDLVGAGKLVRGLKDASSPTIERLTFAFGDRLSRISGYIKEITGASLRRSTHLEEQLAAREFGLTDQALNRIVDEGRPFFDTARAKSEMLSALDTRPEFVQMKNNTELVYMMERSKVDPAFAAAVAAGTDDAVIALAVSGETKTMATVYEIEKTAKVDDVVKKRLLERQYRDGTSGSYGQRFYEMLRPPPPPR